ncbi:MAG: DNA-directed RNA polymerase subunit alpha [Candidatus Pacebacteria bacterium]|nr:DNA-directed RNA polymerase subunit alpha [Candidatus Paceibacterota bacterium]
MSEQYKILLPSKPKIISESEEDFSGVYEIDGLYPGYGHTLGNSLRRIILSSIPGVAVTSVRINGVDHEFSTLKGIKEDVINIILNLKKVRFKVVNDEVQTVELKVKGIKDVTAADIIVPGQVEILNPEQYIASITDKNTELVIEIKIQRGLGFVSKEELQKDKMEIGTIALDAIFTPIRRVNYEVENMRVGDRTDFNKLIISLKTDGSITAKETLEKSIFIMIEQLKAIIGFEDKIEEVKVEEKKEVAEDDDKEVDSEFLKTRIETLDLSVRTVNALSNANIRTIGGLARKKEKDLLEIEGLGSKGIQEIKKSLSEFSITLK